VNELPSWVFDLIAEIEQWEDDGHDPGGDSTLEQVRAVCHNDWLELVPKDVRATARAIRAYENDKRRTKETEASV
jgi:hypothetical protein